MAVATLLTATAAGAAVPRGLDHATPPTAPVIAPFSPDSLATALRTMPLHAIEGIYQWADIDTRVAIVRSDATPASLPAAIYMMIVVHASDPSLRPGTVIGYLAPTGQRDRYDARIYTRTSPTDCRPCRPGKFEVELSDASSRLSLKAYGERLRFNWWRLLPFRLRSIVTPLRNTRPDASGLLRIYPAPQHPHHPVYL